MSNWQQNEYKVLSPDATNNSDFSKCASIENASIENASIQNASIQNASIQNASIQNDSIQNASSQNVSIQNVPVTSVICEPSKNSSVKLRSDDATICVKGYAFSGGGNKILRVDVSADGGKTWTEATLNNQVVLLVVLHEFSNIIIKSFIYLFCNSIKHIRLIIVLQLIARSYCLVVKAEHTQPRVVSHVPAGTKILDGCYVHCFTLQNPNAILE